MNGTRLWLDTRALNAAGHSASTIAAGRQFHTWTVLVVKKNFDADVVVFLVSRVQNAK